MVYCMDVAAMIVIIVILLNNKIHLMGQIKIQFRTFNL